MWPATALPQRQGDVHGDQVVVFRDKKPVRFTPSVFQGADRDHQASFQSLGTDEYVVADKQETDPARDCASVFPERSAEEGFCNLIECKRFLA